MLKNYLAAALRGSVRRGEIDAREYIYWADANVFDVLKLPAFALRYE